jgi:hypothetical protein
VTFAGLALSSMSRDSKSSTRLSALCCLFALLLVYAPKASATLMVVTGACCTGDQCPIHGNHRPTQKGATQKSDDVPMDCGHEGHGMKKMQACSMSCCHTIEQAVAHAHLFLLTPVSLSTALAPQSLASFALTTNKISPVFTPLAPPPKSLAS